MRKLYITRQFCGKCLRLLLAAVFALCFVASSAQGQSTRTFTEWPVGSPLNCPFGVFAASSSVIYFTDAPCSSTARIGMLDTATNTVTEWTGGAILSPQGVVAVDGMVFFADQTAGTMNMLNPSTGQLSTWALPIGGSGPLRVVAVCGQIFFTEQAGRIGMLNPLNNEITEWTIPGGPNTPLGITSSRDGRVIWFSQANVPQLGALNRAENTFQQWTIPNTLLKSPFIQGVATSAEDEVFFGGSSYVIGRLNPSSSSLTLWSTPVLSGPTQIVVRESSGVTEVNFVDQPGNSLWRLLPAKAAGTTSEIPSTASAATPTVTVVTPTISILTTSAAIVTPTVTSVAGVVSGGFEQWVIPSVASSASAYALAKLPGGGLAFTEASGNTIGILR